MKPDLSDISEQHMHSILADLSRQRPFFYSEKDFQFCLGWALKTQYNTEVIFEKRYEPVVSDQADKPHRQYIDIVLRGGGRIVPIELKYKTRKAAVKDEDGRDYMLLDQSAQDLGCYHFIRDIARIEAMKREPGFHRGYAILLTNDPYYYHMGGKRNPSYEDFLLYEGDVRQLQGRLVWKDREDIYPAVALKGAYSLSAGSWRSYSEPLGVKYLLFETV